ncbi:MAG: agarase, partial [Planctomycetota bacterium]
EKTVAVIADEVNRSPWCIGAFVDNEKSWGLTNGPVDRKYALILDALSLDAKESPAKEFFTSELKRKYLKIEALNSAWGLDLKSWDEFQKSISLNKFSEPMVADFSMMLRLYGDQYFRIVHAEMKKHLPNHLYLGAWMARWGMPKEVVEAAIKYVDVLSFNNYDYGVQSTGWEFFESIDRPAIIGEFHIGTTQGSGMYHPGLIAASSQKDRARLYKRYLESVTSHPNFVGVHWFQYTDQPLTGRAYDGQNANIGFVNVADIPYPEMVEAARQINTNLYPQRLSDQ